ncbi:hypothetical protein AB0A71_36155 [Kitasatospora aureofaciens]|uniref:hypothetical protein n=1 Tax=Kitasatospora aureofaciens TaxID=1894 RepID=UPI0033C0E471
MPVALAVAAPAWLVLIAGTLLTAGTRGPYVAAVAAVMCAAGAVLAVTDANGLVFTGVAASLAAVAFDPVAALALCAAGPLAG